MRKTKLGVCRLIYVIPGAVSGHDIECDVDQWLSASVVVVCLVTTIVSTSQSNRPIHVPIGNENHGPSYVGLPEELEDFRLLLDQRSQAKKIHISGHLCPPNLHPHADVDVDPDVWPDAEACTTTDEDIATDAHAAVDASINVEDNANVLGIWGTLLLHIDSDTNADRITILLGWFISITIGHGSGGYTMGA
ncbi:hypothetical protein PVK06_027535 [Gossypium arboreum]|uniref:Uncharacterized protein n=1 Tax=Gossypium arboreum TaxID=29729 RepID=A0ABR0P3H0_GOSAR|nr:hypothetical protein PVK06_027535 [Gossypium arboreum]